MDWRSCRDSCQLLIRSARAFTPMATRSVTSPLRGRKGKERRRLVGVVAQLAWGARLRNHGPHVANVNVVGSSPITRFQENHASACYSRACGVFRFRPHDIAGSQHRPL